MAALTDYDAYISAAAKKYGVSPDLIKQVIKVESSGNPTAASGTGPVGLMQISKALASQYGYSKDDRLDPEKNIDMGARYLAENLKAFGGDTQKALLGYNQGTGGAQQMLSGKIPMAPEGQKYMTNKNFKQFMTGDEGNENYLNQVSNPMGVLSQTQVKDKFNPNYITRQGAEQAPTQADVAVAGSVPDVASRGNPNFQKDYTGTPEDKKGTNWINGIQMLNDTLQSIQIPKEQQLQFGGGGSALGARAAGFNFDPRPFQNKLAQQAYQELYYKRNFNV